MLDRARGHDPNQPFYSWCPLNPSWARDMKIVERARVMGCDAFDPRYASTTAARRDVFLNGLHDIGDVNQALDLLHGIPNRDPTAWRPLVEFCMAIPDDQYLKDGVSRRLARRLLAGKVPDMVLTERRRGVQTADWPARLGPRRGALIAEVDRLSADPAMAARLDLPRLRTVLADWDGNRPPHGSPQAATLLGAVPRALATARFIRFVEGRNDV